MKDYDWSRFRLRINIRAGVQDIYDAWATQAMLEKWFLRSAEFTKQNGEVRSKYEHVEAGDTYKWHWHGWDDNVVERGKILEVNGRDLFRFTCYSDSIVTVYIKMDVGDELVAEVWQENIPTDDDSKMKVHINCRNAWTFYLTNLKSLLESGHDLRNTNVKLLHMLNS